jgi:hypothetical protein
MTTSDKTKAQVLAGLLAIAGLTWFFVSGGTVIRAPKNKPKPVAQRPVPDPKIHFALLDDSLQPDTVGRNSIFQYRLKPLQNSPAPRAEVTVPVQKSSLVNTTEQPQQKPQSPARAWKYEGFSKSGDKMLASVSEGNMTHPMGLYCIRQLTENAIEIEDLQLKERWSVPRTQ